MKESEPLVSILLPVCNAASTLPEALESLLKQTYQTIEIIVIDDDSRDESYSILKRYKRLDKRIRLYKNKKRYGLAICYNRAVKRAKGTFIAFMNPSDLSSLHRIKRQLTFLLKHPRIAGVGTQYTVIDEKKIKLEKSQLPSDHEDIYRFILAGSSAHFETLMINRLLLPKDALYFRANAYPYLFTEIFMKLLKYAKFANLDQYLYFHRREQVFASLKLTKLDKIWKNFQLWVRSVTVYDYRPSLRSFFTGFAK